MRCGISDFLELKVEYFGEFVIVVVVANVLSVVEDRSVTSDIPECPRVTARLHRGQQEVVYCCPCGVGQATCSEGGLDIASNSGLEGDRVTDSIWHRKAWWARACSLAKCGKGQNGLFLKSGIFPDSALLILSVFVYLHTHFYHHLSSK